MLFGLRAAAKATHIFILGAALTACGGAKSESLPLKKVMDAPFGPATRRFDYASLDPKTKLLFVADLAGGHVLAFDIQKSRLLHSIDGETSVHGVLAVPEQGRVYVSATGRDQVDVIDEASFSVIASIPTGHYPDGIAWDPRQKRVYVSDEHGDTVTAIDTITEKVVATIPLGGDVGNTQYDQTTGRIYSAEQSHNDFVGIDPETNSIVTRDKLTGCNGAHGLQIDSADRLAFIACEDNARLVSFSLATHRQIASEPIGNDPDVLAYDPGLHRLYVSSESGVISVFRVDAQGATKLGQGFLANNAHVVAVDPATHRVYFPLKRSGNGAVLRVMEPSSSTR
ncbi:MAG: YncE family protein [Sphingomonas sp.]